MKVHPLLYSIASILVFGAIWEILPTVGWLDSRLIPPPSQILRGGIGWIESGEFRLDIVSSLTREIIGLVLGCFLGIILGLLTGRIKTIDYILSPLFHIFRAFPPVALLPVFITVLGIEDSSKVFSIAFACFFPTWLNTHIGAANIPIEYIQSAKLLSNSPLNIFYRVILPASSSAILTGIRLSIAIGFVLLYVSELAGASEGLGYRIANGQMSYRMDVMFAALFVLGGLAALTDWLFVRIMTYFLPWLRLSKS